MWLERIYQANMKRILLTSHGRFALGLKESLEIFLGESDWIIGVGAYIDSTDTYLKEIQTFVDEAVEGESVIFTDIYGGSVNQQVTQMVIASKKKIPIVTSMNLPIVLSVALSEEALVSESINRMVDDCVPKVVTILKEEEGDIDAFFD